MASFNFVASAYLLLLSISRLSFDGEL